MRAFRLRITFSVACSLVVCGGLHSQSMAEVAAPKQDAPMLQAAPQGASNSQRDTSLEQATLLMRQGKNEEALPWIDMAAELIRDELLAIGCNRGAVRRTCYRGSTNVLRRYSEMPTATVMGYCMKCKTQREIKDSKQVTMKNGRPATEGVCPVCGTRMFKIGAAK